MPVGNYYATMFAQMNDIERIILSDLYRNMSKCPNCNWRIMNLGTVNIEYDKDTQVYKFFVKGECASCRRLIGISKYYTKHYLETFDFEKFHNIEPYSKFKITGCCRKSKYVR